MEIDLHIHSNKSDGILTPKEIIDVAKKNGVKILSITDHDTTEAYTKELFDYATTLGITLIKGVEISTKKENVGIHILGYNYDLFNKELNDKLLLLRNARHKYLYDVSVKLKELGYVLNKEELDKIESVTKAHIALDIINNESNKEKLLKEFGHIPSKGEFIETIMNKGCKAYVKKESITPKDAADLIRKANGKVVLAHPVAYTYEDNLSMDDITSLVNEIKPDGIEGNYIYVDKNNTIKNDIQKWNDFAKKHNLISTIGSDFHNYDNIHPTIGLFNENIILTKEMIKNINTLIGEIYE